MSEELRNPRIHPRRIVERPRLIQELESSGARVMLLVAGAGWGKTVLAEQWSSRATVSAGWFRARSSAADVSVVARGLVAAAEDVVPGVGRRLLGRLAATQDPEREAVLLAELLAEDLRASWPRGGWVIVDGYDHISRSKASDLFVETLAAQSSCRLLILTGSRPDWAHSGVVSPDAVFELREKALRMTPEEIDSALKEHVRSPDTAPLARGWPAVVGLASMLPDLKSPELSSNGALYEFYCDAVFDALPANLQDDLRVLSGLPSLDREVAAATLGTQRAHEVCTVAVELGLLEERQLELELHSLFREFLMRRAAGMPHRNTTTGRALKFYRERRDWDSGFELIQQHALDGEVSQLVLEAVDELLFSGRLPTLERWVRFARDRGGLSPPVFEVAEIEMRLRQGRPVTALTKARAVIQQGLPTGELGYRLLMAAGRAAHAGHREDEALDYYRQARRFSTSGVQDREAQSAEVMCLSVLERPEAQSVLQQLVSSAVVSDARDQVRLADRQLGLGFRFGFVRHLPASRRAAELVDQVDDPFTRCSFLTVHAWALTLGAYYQEALSVSERLIEDTKAHRVDLALPYAYSTHAIILAGLNRRGEAREAVEMAERYAKVMGDENGVQNAYSTRVRVLLQDGDIVEACAVEPPDVSTALPSTRGEVLGTRALALVTLGRVTEAIDLAGAAGATSSGIEAQALCAAVRAVAALKLRSDEVVSRCEDLIEHVFDTGSLDFAVTAYRANPEMLGSFFASARVGEQAMYLIRRAGDDDRAQALGFTAASALDPAARLSGREQEVYELLCQGLSNAEIARRLFITEGTVKAHVHHVFDKLGIRSRNALALNAARDRYATSTAANSETGSRASETVDPNPTPRAAR